MNWFNMPVHSVFVRKTLPQLLQLNGGFLSWNDSIWPFNKRFWEKALPQSLQLNDYFSSWTEYICALIVINIIPQ